MMNMSCTLIGVVVSVYVKTHKIFQSESMQLTHLHINCILLELMNDQVGLE